METNLRELIGEAIDKFKLNRMGPQPKVLVKIPGDLPVILWQDEGLAKFVKNFLYHALLSNNPDTPIQILVHERHRLKDLEGFVGVFPLCWVQLRIEGHGAGMIESAVEEIFGDLGYRSEEWVGVEGSESQLGIFSPVDRQEPKLVLCIDSVKSAWKCDFLIPVSDRLLLPLLSGGRKKN
ncbi:MAG TPA: hypothetical protein VGA73_00745 [Candidatus Binatia bacterium]